MTLPFTERCVLLTGAGGSIGAALAREILQHNPRALLLLDHSEGNLHQIQFELSRISRAGQCRAILGDITDSALLAELFQEERPEIVIHAAACKHVPLMERNPIAALRNNALGTNQLAKVASAHGTRTFVMVSTDKAVNPHSIMGATKRVAELALLRWSSARSPMGAVRLGNVLGSQGSVVPTFVKQIAEGGPVTVSHPEVSRYFFSMTETVDLLISAASLHDGGGIFVPDPGKPVKILALAEQLIRETAVGREIPIVITGLRPGDKMSEEFISERESFGGEPRGKLRLVHTPHPSHPIFDVAIEKLTHCAEHRDLAGILETMGALVPEYRPSESLLNLCKEAESPSR
jgi:FlaA1/EpsC-like NDP-sugar epimerase